MWNPKKHYLVHRGQRQRWNAVAAEKTHNVNIYTISGKISGWYNSDRIEGRWLSGRVRRRRRNTPKSQVRFLFSLFRIFVLNMRM